MDAEGQEKGGGASKLPHCLRVDCKQGRETWWGAAMVRGVIGRVMMNAQLHVEGQRDGGGGRRGGRRVSRPARFPCPASFGPPPCKAQQTSALLRSTCPSLHSLPRPASFEPPPLHPAPPAKHLPRTRTHHCKRQQRQPRHQRQHRISAKRYRPQYSPVEVSMSFRVLHRMLPGRSGTGPLYRPAVTRVTAALYEAVVRRSR